MAEDYSWNVHLSPSLFAVGIYLVPSWVFLAPHFKCISGDYQISPRPTPSFPHRVVYPPLESLENTTPKPFAWAEWHAGQLMNQHSCVQASQQWTRAKIEATSGKHANPSCARDEIQGMLGRIAGFSRLSLNKSQSAVHPSVLSKLEAP